MQYTVKIRNYIKSTVDPSEPEGAVVILSGQGVIFAEMRRADPETEKRGLAHRLINRIEEWRANIGEYNKAPDVEEETLERVISLIQEEEER
jgi:hypothetical protein